MYASNLNRYNIVAVFLKHEIGQFFCQYCIRCHCIMRNRSEEPTNEFTRKISQPWKYPKSALVFVQERSRATYDRVSIPFTGGENIFENLTKENFFATHRHMVYHTGHTVYIDIGECGFAPTHIFEGLLVVASRSLSSQWSSHTHIFAVIRGTFLQLHT